MVALLAGVLLHMHIQGCMMKKELVRTRGPPGVCPSADVWTRDVLNLGVKPDMLVSLMRQKLEAAGGKVYEEVQLVGATAAAAAPACILCGRQLACNGMPC